MKLFLKRILSPSVWLPCLIAFVVVQVVGHGFAFAEGTGTGTEDDVLKSFGRFISVLVNVLVFLTLKLLEVGGKVMGTDYITGPEPMSAIRPMWVIIRNFTNIGFVVVLLFLAFTNLFSFGGDGNWTIKEKLPKVIIALVAINFSLLGFRVIIDAVNVGMVSILSITDTASEAKKISTLKDLLDGDDNKINSNGEQCSGNAADCKPFSYWINKTLCPGGEGSSECLGSMDPTKIPNDSTSNNIIMAFAVQFQGLEQMVKLSVGTKSWTNVSEHVIFSAILVIAYMSALLAVFVAMLARIVVLWIAMVFSPIIIAGWVMGFADGEGSEVKEIVVAQLIMPLKIAAAFAVCFVMMVAMQGSAFLDVSDPDIVIFKPGLSLSSLAQGGAGLLWKIATIVVFWKVAFWAIDKSVAKGITDVIKTGTEQFGTFAARAATVDRQIFKLPNGQDVSLASLGRIPEAINAAVGNITTQKGIFKEMQKAGFTATLTEDSIKKMKGIFSTAEQIAIIDRLKNAKSETERQEIAKELFKPLAASGGEFDVKNLTDKGTETKNDTKKSVNVSEEKDQKTILGYGSSGTYDANVLKTNQDILNGARGATVDNVETILNNSGIEISELEKIKESDYEKLATNILTDAGAVADDENNIKRVVLALKQMKKQGSSSAENLSTKFELGGKDDKSPTINVSLTPTEEGKGEKQTFSFSKVSAKDLNDRKKQKGALVQEINKNLSNSQFAAHLRNEANRNDLIKSLGFSGDEVKYDNTTGKISME
ncbi:hypothetical protein K9L27_04030 [Candidatus Gracilibacteria bacterium]|nr:hypothetical protein [Candidatus Gracilibacteria bacterium]